LIVVRSEAMAALRAFESSEAALARRFRINDIA